MTIIWLIIGVLMAVVPFWLFNTPMDPWSSVTAGAIGAGIFVLILFIATIRSALFSRKAKIYSALFLVATVVVVSTTWTTSYEQSHFQRRTLVKIRTIIGEGIFQAYTYDAMLPPFRSYYLQKPARKTPIGNLFMTINKDRINNGVYLADGQMYSITYLRDVSESGVTLISVDSVARGRDLAFANVDGQTGRLQVKAVLTEKGVRYEREN